MSTQEKRELCEGKQEVVFLWLMKYKRLTESTLSGIFFLIHENIFSTSHTHK